MVLGRMQGGTQGDVGEETVQGSSKGAEILQNNGSSLRISFLVWEKCAVFMVKIFIFSSFKCTRLCDVIPNTLGSMNSIFDILKSVCTATTLQVWRHLARCSSDLTKWEEQK